MGTRQGRCRRPCFTARARFGASVAFCDHEAVEIAFALLAIVAAVVAVTALAERIGFSAPLLLMLVGIGASYVPFIHEPELTPDLILFGFLPPLLYAAAIRSSLIDLRPNRRPIASLSILLVVFTAWGWA